jgi:DUF1365 family protein
MHSCLYTGRVAHERRGPVSHRFQYRLAMAYLDLDEAAGLVRASWWASAARVAPASFRAEDHATGLAACRTPGELAAAIRGLVAAAGGEAVGPVRLLTQLRHWGVYFSPLNLYFCYDAAGERVAAVVAEVSNTPWNERRRYVLVRPPSDFDSPVLRFRHAMAMDANYDWRVTAPGPRLRVHIRSEQAGRPPFDAALALVRRPWRDRTLAALACRFPAANLQILAAIYWQALRLWWKRCPYYPPPTAPSR